MIHGMAEVETLAFSTVLEPTPASKPWWQFRSRSPLLKIVWVSSETEGCAWGSFVFFMSLSSRTELGCWVVGSKAVRPRSKLVTPFLLCLSLFLCSCIPLLPSHLTCLTFKSHWDHSQAGLDIGHFYHEFKQIGRIKMFKALLMCETIKLHSELLTWYYQDSAWIPLWHGISAWDTW